MWVQVDRVQGYNKNQITLVILDLSNFAARISIILGTPTISHVINVMKVKEIDALAMPWVNARVAHLLLVCRMAAIKVGDEIMGKTSSDDYDKVVKVRAERAHTRGCINIMTQALQTGDGSLLQGLTIKNT